MAIEANPFLMVIPPICFHLFAMKSDETVFARFTKMAGPSPDPAISLAVS